MGRPMPMSYEFLAALLQTMLPEIKTMFNWFKNVGYKADIHHCKMLNTGMLDLGTYLKEESGFKRWGNVQLEHDPVQAPRWRGLSSPERVNSAFFSLMYGFPSPRHTTAGVWGCARLDLVWNKPEPIVETQLVLTSWPRLATTRALPGWLYHNVVGWNSPRSTRRICDEQRGMSCNLPRRSIQGSSSLHDREALGKQMPPAVDFSR